MICEDIIIKLTDHCIAESRDLQNIDLTVIIYNIINVCSTFLNI